MGKVLKLLRNDDVAADTTLHEIQTFCEICDHYGVTPIHAITPIGRIRSVDCRWSNQEIRERTGTALFSENREVVEYLHGRGSDQFAVHGLWHTHKPSEEDIRCADIILTGLRLWPFYFVPPFNEGEYKADVSGALESTSLAVLGAGLPRIEDYLESGDPQAEMMYTHSWRFEAGMFTWKQFDSCLRRLTRHA